MKKYDLLSSWVDNLEEINKKISFLSKELNDAEKASPTSFLFYFKTREEVLKGRRMELLHQQRLFVRIKGYLLRKVKELKP